jgi:hypothetical protein
MEQQIHVMINTEPIRVVEAEVEGLPDIGIPESVSGRLLGVPLEDLVRMKFSENVTAIFKARTYKFSELDKDGSFQLMKAW